MTSRAEKLDASPAWVERTLAATKAAARTTSAARAKELRAAAARRAPRLELHGATPARLKPRRSV
jgi:hypothetical protein